MPYVLLPTSMYETEIKSKRVASASKYIKKSFEKGKSPPIFSSGIASEKAKA
jgi:hypothetical protein